MGKDSITVQGGMQMVDFCLEPKTWQVEEEGANKKGDVTKQFVNTKLMTRQTYTLDGISGKLEGGGGITFTEEDGIDYAPTTVQLPGGERVPFLFTIKELENEINKVFDVFDGTIEFAVSNVNAAEGEVGGVFVSSQASDTDLGSKTPKKVLSKGIFYGRVVKE